MGNTELFADFAAMLYRSGVVTAEQYRELRDQIADRGDAPPGLLAALIDEELRDA